MKVRREDKKEGEVGASKLNCSAQIKVGVRSYDDMGIADGPKEDQLYEV